ncbi:RloB-like protein [Mucilaginibacter gossypiicola]|uniref:RloB-like protein n=1 Tax=Mucilaginibacter gossypiicola TaxID=551995 RepID=A0A1H8LVV9_9SPHI|nr:RloB family protein [Mucilaginibacter gossypiicola]SEO09016.1 RloB-like protein [Mucilaginibacter gossypiicola]
MMRLRLNERILILCEGTTEYLYARSLQMELPRSLQRAVSIEIFFQSQNDPKSLVSEARRRERAAQSERNPYDTIWVFFDNDRWPQLSQAFELIERYGYRAAYSSMCIEHWFILHFEQCGRAFANGEEAIRYLRNLWPAYHKTKVNAYHELRERLNTALNNAVRINQNQDDTLPIHRRNPYFTVQELVDFFEQLKLKDI